MQLIKLITPLLAAMIVSGSSIVGTPKATDAPTSGAPAQPTPDGTAMEPLEDALNLRAPSNCSPTGPGFCTLAIVTIGRPIGRTVGIYDAACKSIGSFENIGNYGNWSLGSHLSHTIELTIENRPELQPRGGFYYKGRYTSLDLAYRNTCDDDVSGTECLRVAFDCS